MTQLEQQPVAEVGTTAHPKKLGLAHGTALVTGSIIGVGIFSLPYAVASYGPISLVAMGAATVGAVALAAMFAVMSRRMPAAGGPYAYARKAFGDGWGFSQAWLYWITAWAGNAAIAVGWVFYVEKFLNKSGATGWSIALALAGLWIPAAVNLTGVRNMGVFQVWTTVLKFVPLALMATVGLFFVHAGNFTPWNTSGPVPEPSSDQLAPPSVDHCTRSAVASATIRYRADASGRGVTCPVATSRTARPVAPCTGTSDADAAINRTRICELAASATVVVPG